MENSTVLIIDEDEKNQKKIVKYCSKIIDSKNIHAANFEDCEIYFRKNIPTLIILNSLKKGQKAFEFINWFRSRKKFDNLPIILLSDNKATSEKTKIFEFDSIDFVIKPVDENELIARIKTNIERYRLLEELIKVKARLTSELSQAKEMQNMLLPCKEHIGTIENIYNIKIYSYSKTSSEIGGDFWGVRQIDQDNLSLHITDFSGHGVAAALNTFRLHTLMQVFSKGLEFPAIYANILNSKLQDLLPKGQFATMFYAALNVKDNYIKFITAAPTKPILIRENGKVEDIANSGLPLGVDKEVPYVEGILPFNKGDLLILYSDALIETKNNSSKYLAAKDIIDLVLSCKNTQNTFPKSAFDKLLKLVKSDYLNNMKDDLTINFYYRN